MDLQIWHDGYDWVIAETAEEAARLSQGHTGEMTPILKEAIDNFEVYDKPTLKITPGEGETWVEMTTEEWIAKEGPGYLCSSDY